MNNTTVVGKINFIEDKKWGVVFSIGEYWGKDKTTGEPIYNNWHCKISSKSVFYKIVLTNLKNKDTVYAVGSTKIYKDKNQIERIEFVVNSIMKVYCDYQNQDEPQENEEEDFEEEKLEEDTPF